VEVGVIEGIDVGTDGEAESACQFGGGADGSDFVEMGLECRKAVGFNGGFVHVGAVEVGYLALVGAGGGIGLRGVFDDAGGLFEAEIGERAEDAESGAVGREFGARDKATVGESIKVIAGADGGVHVGDGDAVGERC
jgi:hypothetical protein